MAANPSWRGRYCRRNKHLYPKKKPEEARGDPENKRDTADNLKRRDAVGRKPRKMERRHECHCPIHRVKLIPAMREENEPGYDPQQEEPRGRLVAGATDATNFFFHTFFLLPLMLTTLV